MARKRLTLPFAADPDLAEAPLTPDPADLPDGPLETKAMPFGPASRAVADRPSRQPPISRIAAETAATAALEALAGEVAQARAAGRMVEALPLDAIDTGHLVRDRVGFDGEEFAALVESLRTHGQRAPIEVIDLSPSGIRASSGKAGTESAALGTDGHETAGQERGQNDAFRPTRRYGLISGWRRLSALRRLHEETGEARFATVLALLRSPESSADAYVAMVEENEIRAGLSYYERARIAAKAVEAGAFADRGAALRGLYATASRAKRSKIGSFLVLYDALDGSLRFPAAIGERLGLQLAQRLEEEGAASQIRARLNAAAPADAEAEAAFLSRLAEEGKRGKRLHKTSPDPIVSDRKEIIPGVVLTASKQKLILSGPGITSDFRVRLEEWLNQQTEV